MSGLRVEDAVAGEPKALHHAGKGAWQVIVPASPSGS